MSGSLKISNPDALKAWLVGQLAPMCVPPPAARTSSRRCSQLTRLLRWLLDRSDADTDILSEYVLALLKADMPEDALEKVLPPSFARPASPRGSQLTPTLVNHSGLDRAAS